MNPTSHFLRCIGLANMMRLLRHNQRQLLPLLFSVYIITHVFDDARVTSAAEIVLHNLHQTRFGRFQTSEYVEAEQSNVQQHRCHPFRRIHSANPFNPKSSTLLDLRGGSFDDDFGDNDQYYDDDEYDSEVETEVEPAQKQAVKADHRIASNQRPHKKPNQQREHRPTHNSNQRPQRRVTVVPPTKQKKKLLSTSTAKSVVGSTTGVAKSLVTGTVSGTGQAAYYIIQPKHVDEYEIHGLWRMDYSVKENFDLGGDDDEEAPSTFTYELTAKHEVVYCDETQMDDSKKSNGKKQQRRKTVQYKFIKSKWPRPARIEFTVPKQWLLNSGSSSRQNRDRNDTNNEMLFFKATAHRKLAAKNVIKFKGTMYEMQKTGVLVKTVKRIPIGTFVARRRVQLQRQSGQRHLDTTKRQVRPSQGQQQKNQQKNTSSVRQQQQRQKPLQRQQQRQKNTQRNSRTQVSSSYDDYDDYDEFYDDEGEDYN